jgi:uncharacterized protein (DUF952 family)
VGLIYHIAYPAEWAAAQRDGEYLTSSRGRTLAKEGFIVVGTLPLSRGTDGRFTFSRP